MALAATPEAKGWWGGPSGARLGERLIERALSDARDEAVAWTPLLDRLAARAWPARTGTDERFGPRLAALRASERLAGVYEAIAAATDPEALYPLLAYEYDDLLRRVAASPSVDERLLEGLQRIDRRPVLEALAKNTALASTLQAQLQAWLLEEAERAQRAQVALARGEERPHTERRYRTRHTDAFGVLRALWRTHIPAWTEDARRTLVRLAPPPRAGRGEGGDSPLRASPYDRFAYRLLQLLDQAPDRVLEALPCETLEALHHRLRDKPESALLVGLPQATRAMWDRLFEAGAHTSMPSIVLSNVSDHPWTLEHDAMRELVLTEGRPWDLAPMADRLREAGLREAVLERLLAMGKRPPSGRSTRAQVHSSHYRALRLALDQFVATADELAAVWAIVRSSPLRDRLADSVFGHEAMDEELAVSILADTQSRTVRRMLVRQERLARMGGVQEALADTRDTRLLPELAREAGPERFAERFRAVVEACSARTVAELLEEAARDQLGALEPSDLKPLLAADDRELRTAALLASGFAGGDPPEEGREPGARASPGR